MAEKDERLGSYRLVERLGRGGMGEVWRATHVKLEHDAAIKLVRPEALKRDDDESRAAVIKRFEREARTTARMSSPHTIRLFDFGSDAEGTLYYAMELLVGLDLESLVDRFGPVEPARVVHFLVQVCDSLAEAHERGLIHRDIKPANIYTCRQGLNFDFVKVLDFGLVKPLPREGREVSQLTVADSTTGTPAFMAPEIALGRQPIDGRADLYSLGCVAYWLLTRSLVFESTAPMRMVIDHIQTPPVPPSKRAEREIPAALEALVLACLEKSPDDRPPTAQVLRRQLLECDAGSPWTTDRAEGWWQTHLPELFDAPGALAATRPSRADEEGPNGDTDLRDDALEPRAELSETRREVLRQLRNNFAYSVIDIDEYERRAELVESAATRAELEAVRDGLRPLDSQGGALVPVTRDDRALVPASRDDRALVKHPSRRGRRVIAFLSGATRRGRWEPARTVRVVTLVGGAKLDFRRAKLLPGVTEVKLFALLGGVEIIVPPDLPVLVDGIGIMGGFDDTKVDPVDEIDPDRPQLRVSGLAILGGADVKTRALDEPLERRRRRRRHR